MTDDKTTSATSATSSGKKTTSTNEGAKTTSATSTNEGVISDGAGGDGSNSISTSTQSSSTKEATLIIGCKAPSGVVLTLNGNKSVVLNGPNTSNPLRPRGGAGFTKVPSNLWDQVIVQYGNSEVFLNGCVFVEGKNEC